MKAIAFVAFISLFPAHSKATCGNLPSYLDCKSVAENFNGSIYIEEPKLFAGGKFTRVSGATTSLGQAPSATGLCVLLGKKMVSFKVDYSNRSANVFLNEDGSFNTLWDEDSIQPFALAWVTCK